jgi:hypothetical protein
MKPKTASIRIREQTEKDRIKPVKKRLKFPIKH